MEETTAPTVAETVPETTAPAETEAVEETTAPTVAETEPPRRMLFAAPRTSGVMAAAEGEETETEIIDITIYYRAVTRHDTFETTGKDAGNRENAEGAANAADAYVAHIISGSDLEVTVPCRVIPGYELTLPDFNPGGLELSADGNNLQLNLYDVTEDLTFYAYYQEKTVSYTARYFLQNVYNDLYTEDTKILTDTIQAQMKGYPGDEPNKNIIYPTVTGFSALFFQPDTIAADGSTVFEVYYDRNYYLMNYNMDGGFGTAPVYARYGTAFTVANPTKPGHVFAGWELELINGKAATAEQKAERPDHPSTIPAENRTYKAKWTKVNASYTVAYWILDDKNTTTTADDIKTYLGNQKKSEISGTSVSGEDDLTTSLPICGNDNDTHEHNDETCYIDPVDLRYMDFVKADQNVTVEGDGSTVVNVYYEYREYTLRFYYARTQGGTDSEDDEDIIPDAGFDKIEVVGGSTWKFGYNGWYQDFRSQNTADDDTLLKAVTEWGEITEFPQLKRNDSVYDKSALKVGDYWYHYLSFTARYGDNISKLWPCDVIEPATRKTGNTHTWNNTTTVVSAWNGEHRVRYTRVNENPTIKGLYERLDENLLFHTDFTDDTTISYLCFWENGANIGWSVPELYVYNIWLTCITDQNGNLVEIPTDSQTNQPKKTKRVQIKGYDTTRTDDDEYRWFYLDQSYRTCDDSTIKDQTRPSVTGYSGPDGYRLTEWEVIFLTNATLQNGVYTGGGGTTYTMSNYQVDSGGWKQTQELTVSTSVNGLLHSSDYSPNDSTDHTMYREGFYRDYYYYRNVHRLYYRNHDKNMGSGDGAEVPFGKSLVVYGQHFSKKDMEEKYYPSTLESNAYYFDGWYTSADCLPGTEMDWTGTMPDSDITVYAKWEPVTYNTYFYMDHDRYNSKTLYQTVIGTPHGEKMITSDVELTPTFEDAGGNPNTEYRFVGWFYYDTDGTKKAFNPAEMAVRKELHLFAEWTTTQVSEYKISYQQGVLDESTGEYVAVSPAVTLAKDYEGYALEATTKTFTAKSKDQLTSFPAGTENALWLPHTNSHSIVMRSDKDENVFTFYYIKADEAPYEVRYLDAATGEPIRKDEKGEEIKGGDPHNKSAVVTETFVYIPGYIPDAFHKRLILSANEEENVIIFYYTKDNDNPGSGDVGGGTEIRSRYLVTHHVPELDGTYTSRNPEDNIGVVGKKATATELELPGFEFDVDKTIKEYEKTHGEDSAGENVTKNDDGKWTVSGIVTTGEDDDKNKPLELHLYYMRRSYDYRVEHRDWDTKELLKREENGEKVEAVDMYAPVPFETEVSVTATNQDFTGYTLYGANDQGQNTQTLTISWDKDLNVITFYYIQRKVTIQYEPVCTMAGITGFGGVSNPLDFDKQTPSGSEAYAASGFRFKGWYMDADGNTQITDESWFPNSNKNHIVPKIDPNSDIYDYTYYAVFEPIETSLKIVKEVADNDVTGADFAERATDSFLFRVQGKAGTSTKDVDMTVVIHGSGEVTIQGLNCGEYTVTELTDWSWTYDCKTKAAVNKKITELTQDKTIPESNTFSFTNAYNDPDWLGGENYYENRFT